MATYVVGILNFFDNENVLYKVSADNEVIALREALIASCKEEAQVDQALWFDSILSNLKEVTQENLVEEIITEAVNCELAVTKPLEI